ncbi:MAG: four helix bundle protein [Thermodesulfovibrionales bacterium]
MSTLKSYCNFIVWQKSIELAKKIYALTHLFPKEEMYGLTSQLRRASVSICCNIAEGQARNSTGEFKQFLGISKGSLAELETLLLLRPLITGEHMGVIMDLLSFCDSSGNCMYISPTFAKKPLCSPLF